MNPYLFDAAILAALGFVLYQLSTLGRFAMTATQDVIDAVVNQLGKAQAEIVAKIADVQAQLDAANVPAEVVDLSALTEAAQKLDDIVPDATPVDPAPVEDVPADVPADPPVDVPVEEVPVEEVPVEDVPADPPVDA